MLDNKIIAGNHNWYIITVKYNQNREKRWDSYLIVVDHMILCSIN